MTLHNEQDAIKQAIEGGWIAKCCVEPEKNWHWYKAEIFQDPRFWQALGKTQGWGKKMVVRRGVVIGNFCIATGECFEEMGFGMDYLDPWMYYALRYFETLMLGGDMKAYWESLP